MTAEYPQGDEPLIPMAALSLPALRQVVAMVAPSRPPAGSTPPNAPSPTPTPRSGTGHSPGSREDRPGGLPRGRESLSGTGNPSPMTYSTDCHLPCWQRSVR